MTSSLAIRLCCRPLSRPVARGFATSSPSGSDDESRDKEDKDGSTSTTKKTPLRKRIWGALKSAVLLKSTYERLFVGIGVKDHDLASFLASTASLTTYTMVGLSAAGTLGVDTSPLLAGVGVTGFTVGFALRDIASNYLSGVILLLNRPFRPGQLVTIGDQAKKLKGVYQRMDLRYTYLKALPDPSSSATAAEQQTETIMVPNQTVFAMELYVRMTFLLR